MVISWSCDWLHKTRDTRKRPEEASSTRLLAVGLPLRHSIQLRFRDTLYIARFMGGHNVLNGTVTAVTHGMATLVSASGERYATLLPTQTVTVDDTVCCSIRRDRIAVTKAPLCGAVMPAEPNTICGTVHAIEYQGAYVKVSIQRPG